MGLWYAETKDSQNISDTGGFMKKNNVIAYAGVALITAAVLGGAFVVKNMFFKPD